MGVMRKQFVKKFVGEQQILRRTPSGKGSEGTAPGICCRACWSAYSQTLTNAIIRLKIRVSAV
jgi:hypothetical protein